MYALFAHGIPTGSELTVFVGVEHELSPATGLQVPVFEAWGFTQNSMVQLPYVSLKISGMLKPLLLNLAATLGVCTAMGVLTVRRWLSTPLSNRAETL